MIIYLVWINTFHYYRLLSISTWVCALPVKDFVCLSFKQTDVNVKHFHNNVIEVAEHQIVTILQLTGAG